jgi:hypothetical protein
MTSQNITKNKEGLNLEATKNALTMTSNLDEEAVQTHVETTFKPKYDFHMRCHSDVVSLWCLEVRDETGKQTLTPLSFDDPELYLQFADRKWVQFTPCITTYGTFGYWNLKQFAGIGREMPSHTSGKIAYQTAIDNWSRIYWYQPKGVYECMKPKNPEEYDKKVPQWPKEFLEQGAAEHLFQGLKFEDRLITTVEDTRIKRLLGEIF